MKLPRIRIEWYRPSGLTEFDEYKKEIEFNDGNDLVIIKASALRNAQQIMSRKMEKTNTLAMIVEEHSFEFKTDHFLVVDKSWDGYEAAYKLWKEAAEAMDWGDEE